MSDPKNDPIKGAETIIVNICEKCGSRYSFDEAKERNMQCCGQPLTEREERVSMPIGP